jgi:hypothetical protein
MCPDHRQHRGAHPEDRSLFAPERLDTLRTATADLSWLLSRGYAMTSSLKLVGDRYNLQERQRTAISRATCTDQARREREQRSLPWESLHGADIEIDGFNLLITLEAAFGGGLIMHCRDDCLRDLASMHGSYRAVQETEPALELIGTTLEAVAPRSVLWLLDSPVSNSGRLAQTLRTLAQERHWPWQVEAVFNPDALLRVSEQVVVSSDSVILDSAARWVNAAAHLIHRHVPDAWLADFRSE